MLSHFEEDLPVKLADPIDQLIHEEIRAPDLQEVNGLDETSRSSDEFGSIGMNNTPQCKDPSRVSVLQGCNEIPYEYNVERTS